MKKKRKLIIEDNIDIIQDFMLDISSKYNEVVIFNIGSDKNIGDSFGPLLGTLLKEANLKNFIIYGTLDKPIHALNLDKYIEKVKESHPDAYIVATDACIDSENSREKECVEFSMNISVKPGAGVGKKLQSVGDSSVKHIIKLDNPDFFMCNSRRLNDSFIAARQTCNLFVKIDEMISDSGILDEAVISED